MDAAHDHLLSMLSRLKLTAIRDQLDSLVDEAGRRELTIREALGLFCEREIARKEERRIEMSIGLAIPVRAGPRGLRLRGAALDRRGPGPRARDGALHRERRGIAPLRASRRRQDACIESGPDLRPRGQDDGC